eukprot:3688774-Prymnesium_polylepis.2
MTPSTTPWLIGTRSSPCSTQSLDYSTHCRCPAARSNWLCRSDSSRHSGCASVACVVQHVPHHQAMHRRGGGVGAHERTRAQPQACAPAPTRG